MKKIIYSLCFLLAVCLLAACGSSEPATTKEAIYLYDISDDGTITITGIKKYANDSIGIADIPNEIDGKTVTAIGDEAFCRKKDLIEVIIPDTVTEIGAYAFMQCDNLETVVINGSLTEIKNHTFSESFSLKSVNIPDGVTSIGDFAFYFTAVEKIVIPEGVKGIGESAFSRCYYLKSISLPESLEWLDASALADCSGLERLNIPAKVEMIGFIDATDNQVVDAGEGLKGCTSLHEITVAEGNQNYIAVDGVLYDRDMTVIYLYPAKKPGKTFTVPEDVERIGDYAFYGCSELEEVIILEGLKSMAGFCFWKCEALKTVEIPSTVYNWSSSTFEECDNVTLIIHNNKNVKEWAERYGLNCIAD